jgi:uncharacterized protein
MRSKLLHQEHGLKTFALVFDKDEEVTSALLSFASQNEVSAAQLTGIGAFSEITLGYFDRERKDYKRILLREQVEVLSLIGNVGRSQGQPKIHAHVVVGKSDGTAHGGHLLEARVWPTLELIVVETPKHLQRRIDHETGLPLLDLAA